MKTLYVVNPGKDSRIVRTKKTALKHVRAGAIVAVADVKEGPTRQAEEVRAEYAAGGWGHAPYLTPSGHTLHRPLLLPGAETWSDVFDAWEPWDFTTMNHRNGHLPAEGRRVRDAYTRMIGRNEIGPFASVDLGQAGGPKHGASQAVRANDAVVERIAARIVTDDDRLSFKVIAHKGTGRAVVICSHGYIIGSHYVAYIDVNTVPGMEGA